MNHLHIAGRLRAALFCLLLLTAVLLLTACGGRSSGETALDAYLGANEEEVTKPISVDGRPVTFTVAPGSPARLIGQQLVEQGLIGDAVLFEAYVRINGLAERLSAGTFSLRPNMTLVEVVETLTNPNAGLATVTIPEGWRLEQSADMLAAGNALAEGEAERYRTHAALGDLTGLDVARYNFLQERPAGASLEGYLFPDTYALPPGASALDLLSRQLDVFAQRVVPLYQEARATGTTQLSLYEVMTLASIVEREAVVAAERPAIAAVYLNRLAVGMKLDADPTVQYALGYQPESEQWWKTPVFLEEYTSAVSPYNTYLNTGLPPGPIASPGLSSIEAVLLPEPHTYLFFVALPDGSGRHVFASTFEEHQENVLRYQSGG